MKQYKIKIGKNYEWSWNYIINVYFTLNEFIDNYKQYYPTNREIKTHTSDYDFTFNDIFHGFINYCLYDLHITKNEKITIHKHDEYIIIYTNNKCYVWDYE